MNTEMVSLYGQKSLSPSSDICGEKQSNEHTLSSYASEVTTSRGEQGIHVFTMYNFGGCVDYSDTGI